MAIRFNQGRSQTVLASNQRSGKQEFLTKKSPEVLGKGMREAQYDKRLLPMPDIFGQTVIAA